MIWLYLKKTHIWPILVLFSSILGLKMNISRQFHKMCDHLAIRFSTMYDSTIFKEKPFLTLFLVLFWDVMGHSGSKSKKFHLFIQKLRSPCHKLSNGIWYDYIWRKPIFGTFWSFFALFWAILGPKVKKFRHFYEICNHLVISFPTIYDMTIFEENQFLTLFGPFLVHFGPKNENFQKKIIRCC